MVDGWRCYLIAETRKELTLTRVLNAPREQVFRAWTEPELLVQWWGPQGVTNVECEIDARVGGTIRVVMVGGEELGDLAGERWPMRGETLDKLERFVRLRR